MSEVNVQRHSSSSEFNLQVVFAGRMQAKLEFEILALHSGAIH